MAKAKCKIRSKQKTTTKPNERMKDLDRENSTNEEDALIGIQFGLGLGKGGEFSTILDYLMIQGKTTTWECAHQLGMLCVIREVLIVNLIPFNYFFDDSKRCNDENITNFNNRNYQVDYFPTTNDDFDLTLEDFITILASYDIHCNLMKEEKRIFPTSIAEEKNNKITSPTNKILSSEKGERNKHDYCDQKFTVMSGVEKQNVDRNDVECTWLVSEERNKTDSTVIAQNNIKNGVWDFLQSVEKDSKRKRSRVQTMLAARKNTQGDDEENSEHLSLYRSSETLSSISSLSKNSDKKRNVYYQSYSCPNNHNICIKEEEEEVYGDEKELSTLMTLMEIANNESNETKKYQHTRRDVWKFLDKVKDETSRKKVRAYKLLYDNHIRDKESGYRRQQQKPHSNIIINHNKNQIGRLERFLSSSSFSEKPTQITVTTVDSDSWSRSSLSSFGSSTYSNDKEEEEEEDISSSTIDSCDFCDDDDELLFSPSTCGSI